MRLAMLPCLALTACATFGQKPQPVGGPGPIACVGAQAAQASWVQLDAYMTPVLEAQTAYYCAPVAPPAAEAPAVPALR